MAELTRRNALELLSLLPGGPELCAVALESVPPSLAASHLFELQDYPSQSLPRAVANEVMSFLRPEYFTAIKKVRLPEHELLSNFRSKPRSNTALCIL